MLCTHYNIRLKCWIWEGKTVIVSGAGMIAFRWGQSRVGAIAYQKAIDAGKLIKQAWRAFWNAGTITSLNSSRVKVVSPANGKVQFCD
jgi:hypothetical protein